MQKRKKEKKSSTYSHIDLQNVIITTSNSNNNLITQLIKLTATEAEVSGVFVLISDIHK